MAVNPRHCLFINYKIDTEVDVFLNRLKGNLDSTERSYHVLSIDHTPTTYEIKILMNTYDEFQDIQNLYLEDNIRSVHVKRTFYDDYNLDNFTLNDSDLIRLDFSTLLLDFQMSKAEDKYLTVGGHKVAVRPERNFEVSMELYKKHV